MNIVCCLKSVLLAAPERQVARTADLSDLNPFDRPVLETALRLREETGGCITALSMGPPAAADALRQALALGADRAVLLCDRALAGADTLATSTALAAAVARLLPYDLLLFGTRTSDSDTGQVGPQTAVRLGLPLVTWVHALERTASGFVAERRADGFRERFAVTLPAAMTIHPAAVTPRDETLGGIDAAYEHGVIETWGLDALGCDPAEVGEAGSPTRVVSLAKKTRDRKCELLTGAGEEVAEALVRTLADRGLIG
ncbi:MAG TPA: electron transfer flavoprotein subunit alpha [Syntrophus sp. (in: bacteria)]|nr:electron transfer flavoprotein subunit alpha [Syntrophus sp. (in: bacteria)]